MQVRRSLFLSTADKLFSMVVRFGTLIVTARLMTPQEIGIAVLGTVVLGVAGVIREFGGAPYLIQADEVTPERVRTVFTAQFLFTLPLALIVFVCAEFAGAFYQAPGLRDFLWVTALCFLIGPFVAPLYALLGRHMAFGQIAIAGILATLAYSGAAIGLAFAGFSYMSFAWASLISGFTGFVTLLIWRPDYAIYRFSLHDWRQVVHFGAADSARNLLYYALENLPLLVFGRTIGAAAVGLFQRATTLSALPNATLLSGVTPVLLPAFANHARSGRELKDAFLRSVALMTGLSWPATLGIVILAYPIVLLVLGDQWLPVAPLVQIIGIAYLASFTISVTNPILIAAGGIRDTLKLALVTIPIMVSVQSIASFWGLHAAAASLILTLFFFSTMAMLAVQRRAPFQWREMASVLGRSAGVAACSASGPLLIAFASGGAQTITIPVALVAVCVGVAGWVAGLAIFQHPMRDELQRLLSKAQTAYAGPPSN